MSDFRSILARSGPPDAEVSALFAHETLASFLQHHVSVKRRDPAWSVRRWGRELGHRHGTTLSRVIAGQRAPGDLLAAQLTGYFAFSGLEAQYFGCLVEHARAGEPGLRTLLDIGRRQLRQLNGLEAGAEPRIMRMRGAIVGLQGDVDEAAARRWIPDGAPFAPIAIAGRVAISLNLCGYAESTAGPFSERYLALCVRREGGGVGDWGFWFRHRACSIETLAVCGRALLGLDAEVARVELAIGEHGVSAVTHAGASASTLGFERALPPPRVPHAFDVFGFGRGPGAWCTYRITNAMTKWETPVEPGDRIELPAKDRELLDGLDFQPRLWSVMTELDASVMAPRFYA